MTEYGAGFTPALKWAIGGLTTAFVAVAIWLGVVVYKNANQPTAQEEMALRIEQPTSDTPAAIRDALDQGDSEKIETAKQEETQKKQAEKQPTSLGSQKGTSEGQTEATLTATMETATSGDGMVEATITSNVPVSAMWVSQDCGSAKSGEKASLDKTQTFTLSAADTRACPHWTVTATTAGKQRVSFRIDVDRAVASAPAPQPQSTPSAQAFSASVSTSSTGGQTTLLVTASEPVRIGIDGAPSGDLATTHRRSISAGTHTVTVRTADGREQKFTVGGSTVSSR